MSQPVLIPLTQIVPDSDYQPRSEGLSRPHLAMLAESEPASWPPLKVASGEDGTFVLIDGFHRLETAKRLGMSALPCLIVDGAGYPEAVYANISHGLPLSRNDRRLAARWWAEEKPDLSYREIGRRVGLSDKTVKSALHEKPSDTGQKSETRPVTKFVASLLRAHDNRIPHTRAIRNEIAEYDDDSRAEVASILDSIGRVLIDAAAPHLAHQ